MPFSLRFSFIKKQAFKNILPTTVPFGRGHRASPKELLRTKEAMPGAASQRPSRSLPSAPLPPGTPRGRGRTGCAPPPGGALRASLRAARRLPLRRRAAWQPPQSPQPLYYFFFLFTAGRCFPLGKNFPSRLSGRAPTPRGTAPRGSPAPSSVLPSARSPLFYHHTPLTHGAAPKPPPLPPPFPRLLTCGRARRSQRAQPAAPMSPGGFAAGGRLPGTAPGPLRQRPAEAHGSPRLPAALQP